MWTSSATKKGVRGVGKEFVQERIGFGLRIEVSTGLDFVIGFGGKGGFLVFGQFVGRIVVLESVWEVGLRRFYSRLFWEGDQQRVQGGGTGIACLSQGRRTRLAAR